MGDSRQSALSIACLLCSTLIRSGLVCSVAELGDLRVDAVQSAGQGHVHELGLGVHLQAAHDRLIDLVIDRELLALVLWVGRECGHDLLLLISCQLLRRDDGDLLFLVELLVELRVLLSDLRNEVETLVLSKNRHELEGSVAEGSRLAESLVQLGDFSTTDSTVLGEETELLTVPVQLADVLEILVHAKEVTILRGSGEEDAGVTSLDSVLLRGWLVVGGRVNLADITHGESLEERSVQVEVLFSGGSWGSLDGLRLGSWHLSGLFFGSCLTFLLREEADRSVVEGGLRGSENLLHSSGLESLEEPVGDHLYNLIIISYSLECPR